MPVARLTDLSMTEKKGLDKEGIQQIKQFGLDALSLLTHVNYEINMQRRQPMKPDIGKDYASLCSQQIPFTDYLFGDDLQKQQPTLKKLQRSDLPTLEAKRASQEHTKQQAPVTVDQVSVIDKVNVPKFVAGTLAAHMQFWRVITSGSSILDMVAGYTLEFDDMPFQSTVQLIQKDYWMAVLDLKDAYYSVLSTESISDLSLKIPL